MSKPVSLEVDNLAKRYRSTEAVQDVSFSVARGECVGLVGPNGAGKSTTLKVIAGVLRPTVGRVLVDGHRPADLTNPGQRLGFVFDPAGLPPELNARTCLRFEALAQNLPLDSVHRAIDEYGLTSYANRRTSRLSTGQQQQVALACATIGDPDLLILDEPTNGLDIEAVMELRKRIAARTARGKTTIISSHNLIELRKIVDRVIVINQSLRFDGPFLIQSDADAEAWYLELVSTRASTGRHSLEAKELP